MRNLQITFLVLVWATNAIAQRKVIDDYAIKNWQHLDNYDITRDGNFVWYQVQGINSILNISDYNGDIVASIPNAINPQFSADSKYIFFILSSNLYRLEMKTKYKTLIDNTDNYELLFSGLTTWIKYKKAGTLFLRHSNRAVCFKSLNASQFILFNQSKYVAILSSNYLSLLSLNNGKEKIIYKGREVINLISSKKNNCLVFSVGEPNDISLYFYKPGMSEAQLLLNNSMIKSDSLNLSPENIQFNSSSDIILFSLLRAPIKKSPEKKLITDKVTIWSYKDKFLQSQQALSLNDTNKHYRGAVSIQARAISILEGDDTILEGPVGNKYAVQKNKNNTSEAYWNPSNRARYHLKSLLSGTITVLNPDARMLSNVKLSPGDNYLTWHDDKTKALFIYEISSNKARNLTSSICSIDIASHFPMIDCKVVGWFKDDSAVLISDGYDLWEVDLKGKDEPICLTNRYGWNKKIRFQISSNDELKNLQRFKTALVVGFSEGTKRNGFIRIKLSRENYMDKLILKSCLYYFPNLINDGPPPPLKAKHANRYLLQRQSSSEAPNLYATENFIQFHKISHVRPQDYYKWHKTELIKWKSNDGHALQGILYTPELLDSNKRYPLIINFYEKRSDELNLYRRPRADASNIDIPWYLSRDYIVFIPDIERQTGNTGQMSLKSVESGTLHLLKKYKFIDEERIGLQGHSFGGYVTNYIITHCNLFKAAQSSSGSTDLISKFGGLGFGGISLQYITEIGQTNMGTTPWESPNVYIDNSPIFFVQNVKTPLLLMHGKYDPAVNVSQSIEFFTALRRLGKPVWLLDYDEEGHILSGDMSAGHDFLIRQQQFFDHYLKDKPPPMWMTKGIHAIDKETFSGLDLDTTGTRP